MAGKGWIKLHRKIRDSSIFNDHQLFRLWMICLTEATHKERDQLIDKQTVHLMPGEFVTGRYDIHELYNNGLKHSDKVTGEKTVYRWLEKLQSSGFLTIKKTNKFSIVSIDNWAFYQGDDSNNDHQIDQQMTIKRPSDDQQMTTNKNVKNIENVKNDKEAISSWIKKYKIQCKGIFELEKVESYIGIIDMDLIEHILKKSENKSVPYFEAIANKTILQNIKTLEQWNAKNKPKEEPSDRLAFLNDM